VSFCGGAHPETLFLIRFCAMPSHDQENPGGDVSPPLRTETGEKKQCKTDAEEALEGIQAPMPEGADQAAP